MSNVQNRSVGITSKGRLVLALSDDLELYLPITNNSSLYCQATFRAMDMAESVLGADVDDFEIILGSDGLMEGIRFSNSRRESMLLSLETLFEEPFEQPSQESTVDVGSQLLSVPESKSKATSKRLFRAVELASRILPQKVWIEAFEPHFEDSKASYLITRRRYKGKWERRWLAFCFLFQSIVALIQSLGAMVNEKLKKALWALFGGVIVWLRSL